MADKKRKTLQIKRPDANSLKSKKKPLPKVKMNEQAATSAVDTEELTRMGPKTAKLTRPEETSVGDINNKGKTTRIALPDEEKIRKARRANATQDLQQEDSLPSAEQIAQAQKNATMPIMIDTESVEDSSTSRLNDTDSRESLDRTMEIDPELLETDNLEASLNDSDSKGPRNDQTLEIDPEALQTANLNKEIARDIQSEDSQSDQTMEINPESLKTGNLQEDLRKAKQNSAQNDKDQTMEIDPEALATGNLSDLLKEDDDDSDQTMLINPDALKTGKVDPVGLDEIMSMDTMKMETMKMDYLDEEASKEETVENQAASEDSGLTFEEMKESFNAQTMAMDDAMLAAELQKKSTAALSSEDEDEDRSQTMDLSNNRPKTIMIKRPSKKAPASSSTPTVKAVRPDAVTVRTSRPVTANRGQAKQDTSRIDIPNENTTSGKEGKTIKLRRPSGAPIGKSRSNVSSVAKNAGLTLNQDGSVSAISGAEPKMGAAWLAVAIITLLLSAGAAYSVVAHTMAELPMPGRLVDVNQQLIQ